MEFNDIKNLVTSIETLTRLRRQLDNPPNFWTPHSLEDWHDAVQQALMDSGNPANALDSFNAIPPGRRPSFAIANLGEGTVCDIHYTEFEVSDFLQNGIKQAKEFLDSYIRVFEKALEPFEEEYNKAVIKQIEAIIEKGPNKD